MTSQNSQTPRNSAGWRFQGGTTRAAPDPAPARGVNLPDAQPEVPDLTNAELVQLRIRVIALENLVIALLAEASDRQLDLAREMAAYISPRPGSTHHL